MIRINNYIFVNLRKSRNNNTIEGKATKIFDILIIPLQLSETEPQAEPTTEYQNYNTRYSILEKIKMLSCVQSAYKYTNTMELKTMEIMERKTMGNI